MNNSILTIIKIVAIIFIIAFAALAKEMHVPALIRNGIAIILIVVIWKFKSGKNVVSS